MGKGSMYGLIWLERKRQIKVNLDVFIKGLKLLAFGGEIAVVVENPDLNPEVLWGKAISVLNVVLGLAYASGNETKILEIKNIG